MLEKILQQKQKRISELKSFQGAFQYPTRDFSQAIKNKNRKSYIAEVKPTSPSEGKLQKNLSFEDIVNAYKRAEADALSILTEEDFFHGHLSRLGEARVLIDKPLLCKDFILEEIQIPWVRSAGADAVLLILAALSDQKAKSLKKEIENLNMIAVVEVHTEDELIRAISLSPEIILINNRNLWTLEMFPETTAKLLSTSIAKEISDNTVIISASGLSHREEILQLPSRVDAVLIGSHLMKQADPAAALKALKI